MVADHPGGSEALVGLFKMLEKEVDNSQLHEAKWQFANKMGGPERYKWDIQELAGLMREVEKTPALRDNSTNKWWDRAKDKLEGQIKGDREQLELMQKALPKFESILDEVERVYKSLPDAL